MVLIENALAPNCSEIIIWIPPITAKSTNEQIRDKVIELTRITGWDLGHFKYSFSEPKTADDVFIHLKKLDNIQAGKGDDESNVIAPKEDFGTKLSFRETHLPLDITDPKTKGRLDLRTESYGKSGLGARADSCYEHAFPGIKMISDHYKVDPIVNDGGDIESYDEWLKTPKAKKISPISIIPIKKSGVEIIDGKPVYIVRD